MKDQDHKISRQIVNFAQNNVSTRLEKLTTSNTARTAVKQKEFSWSFYRLTKYIEYKAKLEGIK